MKQRSCIMAVSKGQKIILKESCFVETIEINKHRHPPARPEDPESPPPD
jgi:hypothetical protein